jgi:hypothetical protein
MLIRSQLTVESPYRSPLARRQRPPGFGASHREQRAASKHIPLLAAQSGHWQEQRRPLSAKSGLVENAVLS